MDTAPAGDEKKPNGKRKIVKKTGGAKPSGSPSSGAPKPADSNVTRKLPAGSSGSKGGIKKVPSGSKPGSSVRGAHSSGSSGRRRVQKTEIRNRLAEAKISQRVDGLDVVAKRAEKQAEREAERKAVGGRMNKNVALHVDDTGRKWSSQVKLGIAGGILGVGLIAALLVWFANREVIDPREAASDLRNRLSHYQSYALRMQPFEWDAIVDEDKFVDRLRAYMQLNVDKLEKAAAEQEKSNRTVDVQTRKDLQRYKQDLLFQDMYGSEIVFSMEGENTVIIKPGAGYSGSAVKSVELTVPRLPADGK